jgi:hypothetical protein
MNKHFNSQEDESKKEEGKIEICEIKVIPSTPIADRSNIPNVSKVPPVPSIPKVPSVPKVQGIPQIPKVPVICKPPQQTSQNKITSNDESGNLSLSEQIAKGVVLKKVDAPNPQPRASTTSDDKMGNMMEEMKKIQLKKMNK